jgi:hypothetical protein
MKCINAQSQSRKSMHYAHEQTLESLLRFLPSLCEVSVTNIGKYSIKVKSTEIQVAIRQDSPALIFSTIVYKKNQDDTIAIPSEDRRRYNYSLLTVMMKLNTILNKSRNLEKIISKDENFIYFLNIDEKILHNQSKLHRMLEDFLLTRAEILRNFHRVDKLLLRTCNVKSRVHAF